MSEFKISGLSTEETREAVPHTPILVGYRGSITHGMYVPQKQPDSIDDKDIIGVVLGPLETYIGLDKYEGTERFIREFDCVSYELRKYVSLLLKSNPNVLSLLWLPDRYYIYKTEAGQSLIDNRDIFVSKRIYKSFTGYAYSQLKRMTHYKLEGYMGQKRKELVDKFGYDTKNASHLIRLLRMGIEFLNEGVLYVHRHDRSELLAIKQGEWTLDKVKEEAERLFKRAEDAYDRCTLPAKPNYHRAQELVMCIIKDYLIRGTDEKAKTI